MNEVLDTFLTTHRDRIPGSPMFLQVAGSQSYNLALPDSASDYDFLGVFVRPTHEILRINPPRDHISSGEGDKPDFQMHEVGKFASLLAKGNPTVVEMLYAAPTLCLVNRKRWTPEWDELVINRKMFLNQRTLKQYLGYAQGQWKRLVNNQSLHTTGGEYGTKWAYHVIRLLRNAFEIAKGETPTIWWNGARRKSLMAIRHGEKTRDEVERQMATIIGSIESLKPWNIPEEPNIEWLNSWLFNIRRIAM